MRKIAAILGLSLLVMAVVVAVGCGHVTPPPPPPPPTLHLVTLTITDSTPVTYYNVYRGSACGGVYTLIGTSNTGEYMDEVLGGQQVCYVVGAVNQFGESEKSDPVGRVIPSP